MEIRKAPNIFVKESLNPYEENEQFGKTPIRISPTYRPLIYFPNDRVSFMALSSKNSVIFDIDPSSSFNIDASVKFFDMLIKDSDVYLMRVNGAKVLFQNCKCR